MSATNTVFTLNNGTTAEVAVPSTGSNKGVLTFNSQGNYVSTTGSTIPNTDIKNVVIGTGVTTIGVDAFRYSQNLQSVTFAEGSTCTTIQSNAFQSNVTSISLPSRLEQIGTTAFSGCKFTSLSIPDSVTTIGANAFQFCVNLTSVTLPTNVNFTSIGNGTFYECVNLPTVSFPTNVQTIGDDAFNSCAFTSLNIPASIQTIGDAAFKSCSMETLTFDKDSSLTTIGANAFFQCNNLKTVVIPDSVTTLGTSTSLNDGGVFQYCASLTSVTLPNNSNFTTLKPTTFYECRALKSITIPDSVISIGAGAFEICGALQSVTLGTGVQTIGFLAFDECKALTTLTVNSNIVSTNFMNNHFHASKQSLQTLVLGGDDLPPAIPITTVGGASDGENDGAFASCANLESVTIGAGITTINPNAFVNCSKLATITFPTNSNGTFNSALQTIGIQGFAYCNLTKLTLPPSVTTLGNGAFYDCDNLTEVSLHNNITSANLSNTAFESSGLKILNLTSGNGLGYTTGEANQTIGGEPGVTVNIVSDFKGSYNPYIPPGSTVTLNQGQTQTQTFTDAINPTGHVVYPCLAVPRFANWDFVENTGVGQLVLNPGNQDVGDHQMCMIERHIATGLESEINYIMRIVNINDPPVFMSAPVKTARQESLYSYTVRTNDIDVGDLVTVTATTKPSWLSFDGTTLSGTPSRNVWGEKRVVLLATDVLGATATQTFNIMVRKPICFNEGTKILCLKNGEEQYVAVEQLREGDEVKTMNHGYKKIADMRKGSFKLNGLMDMGMYKMKKQGNMIADLEMTGLHSVLVDANDAKYADDIKRQRGLNNKKFYIDGKFRLRANESHEFKQMEQKEYTIYSFALEEQQEQYGIWANGVLVETTKRKNLEVSNMERVKALVKGKNQ